MDLYTSLIKIVLGGIKASVSFTKPSSYHKRWWTKKLFLLRKKYTHLRNQSQRHQRNGNRSNAFLYLAAQATKQEYYLALRKQKQHWGRVLRRARKYIWNTCRYINNNSSQASFAPVSDLLTSPTTKATTNAEISQRFLTEVFPSPFSISTYTYLYFPWKVNQINSQCHQYWLKKLHYDA